MNSRVKEKPSLVSGDMWTACSYITLVDMLSTLRVSLQIDGGPHAQLAGMHVSRDVSRRKLHQGLGRNVSDLHAITCHGRCCMTCGRKRTAWPCKAVLPVWIVTQSRLRPHTDADSYWELHLIMSFISKELCTLKDRRANWFLHLQRLTCWLKEGDGVTCPTTIPSWRQCPEMKQSGM